MFGSNSEEGSSRTWDTIPIVRSNRTSRRRAPSSPAHSALPGSETLLASSNRTTHLKSNWQLLNSAPTHTCTLYRSIAMTSRPRRLSSSCLLPRRMLNKDRPLVVVPHGDSHMEEVPATRAAMSRWKTTTRPTCSPVLRPHQPHATRLTPRLIYLHLHLLQQPRRRLHESETRHLYDDRAG